MIEDIFNKIREKLDIKNILRENLLLKSRVIIQNCGKGIKNIHSQNLKEVENIIEENKKLIKELISEIDNENIEFLIKGNINIVYQEFTELISLYSLLYKNTLISFEELEIPIEPYLFGLCDTIGELRRYCLDSIRKSKIDEAERALAIMDELFENLSSLNYPNGLLPNFRRKIDIARSVIEKTRGDVTMAWVMLGNKN